MTKNRNKASKLGAGMKPRGNQTEKHFEPAPAVEQPSAVSAEVGQGIAPMELVEAATEVVEAAENRGSQDDHLLQNLESDTVAEREALAEETSAEMTAAADPTTLEDLMKQSVEQMPPVMDASKINQEELRQAVETAPPGKITYMPHVAGLGEQADGTFVTTVTIREGYIEPIRQQADADGVTVDEWLSTRLGEYLDGWWSPAPGR